MRKISHTLAAVTLLSMAGLAHSAYAETTDFGGFSERFKGRGDKIPPRCQIDLPTTATEPFFIKWNCSDDNAAAGEIRTELWLYRNGAPAGELIANFLGFPASVQIDQGLLRTEKLTDGLPASFKLVARDRAGIATISPLFTVRAQDNALSLCSLTVHEDSTSSSGSTTGSPSADVETGDSSVNVTQTSTTQLGIATKGSVVGSPCEIDAICSNDTLITFSSNLTLGSGNDAGKAEGTVSIIPGSLVVNVSGTASVNNSQLQSVNVTGTASIEGRDATVSLTCNR